MYGTPSLPPPQRLLPHTSVRVYPPGLGNVWNLTFTTTMLCVSAALPSYRHRVTAPVLCRQQPKQPPLTCSRMLNPPEKTKLWNARLTSDKKAERVSERAWSQFLLTFVWRRKDDGADGAEEGRHDWSLTSAVCVCARPSPPHLWPTIQQEGEGFRDEMSAFDIENIYTYQPTGVASHLYP